MLSKLMQFNGAHIESLQITPADDMKGVLVLRAPLTREHAETLGVDYLLNGTVVREGVGDTIPLSIELQDVSVHLPTRGEDAGYTTYFPELLHKLKLHKVDGGQFELSFRAHLPAATVHDALDLLLSLKKDPFEMAIRSRQGELFEGGTRVELSAEDSDEETTEDSELAKIPRFGCDLCDSDVPLTDSGAEHVDGDGVVTKCTHPSAMAIAAMKQERDSEPALASRIHMAKV
jgi:hypothetical protein